MIIEISGAESGFKEYLETGRKMGRDLHRDRLDQRIPLFGDLDVFDVATSSYRTKGKRYDHVTLSFSEHHVADTMLKLAVDEFREHVFAAWPESQRHRVVFYAEAHRPKILSYVNAETGEQVERLTHIHIGIGKQDLQTGKFVDLLGHLGPESDNLKFIDAFQESFNTRHGFASPKDNPKITPGNAIDTLARYSGFKPDALGSFNARKSDLEIRLQKEIVSRDIVTWDGFGELLAEFGAVSKVNAGKFNECYRIKPTGADRAIRLTGTFFLQQFIAVPTREKIKIISNKAKAAYMEQMQPKKESTYVTETLNKWRDFTARELRFLHKSSRFYKETFLPADAPTRRQILDEMEREHHVLTSTPATQLRKAAATRSRLPELPIGDLDGVQKRSEMLLFGNSGVDVRNESASQFAGCELRQPDQSRRSVTIKSSALYQPSSVLADIQRTLRERYEQAEDKQRYVEIRQHLNCELLLNGLSHTHGLVQERYRVVTGKDGAPRIQCGSRALTPNDFLTKEMGLSWKEAAPILRSTYENQLNFKIVQPRGKNRSDQLWKEFKQEQKMAKPESSQQSMKLSDYRKELHAILSARLAHEKQATLLGLTGAERKTAAALHAYRSVLAKSELTATMNDKRQSAIATNDQVMSTPWKNFLQRRAQAGSNEALIALRNLDDTWRDDKFRSAAISGARQWGFGQTDKSQHVLAQHSIMPILKNLVFTIAMNGDVTYSNNGRALLRDEGRHIAVLDEMSEDAIVAGLFLAKEKFGNNLTLTGSDEFQRRLVVISVERGFDFKFSNPQLELLRHEIQDQMRNRIIGNGDSNGVKTDPATLASTEIQQNSLSAQYLTASKTASTKEGPDINSALEDESEKDGLISAKTWMENWVAGHSGSVQLASTGHGKVTFTIHHIAADGVVLNQGSSVAFHPFPAGVDLRVGDKVLVNKNGELTKAVVKEKARRIEKSGR